MSIIGLKGLWNIFSSEKIFNAIFTIPWHFLKPLLKINRQIWPKMTQKLPKNHVRIWKIFENRKCSGLGVR